MRSPVLAVLIIAAAAGLGAAARQLPRLTPAKIDRIAQLPPVQPVQRITVHISEIGEAWFDQQNPKRTIERIREVRFPTAFDPPEAARGGGPAIVPTIPTQFETKHTGWTIRVSAKAQGSVVGVFAEADYSSLDLVRGGYGALSGPVYTEDGKATITPNKLELPRLQTTTTHFHVFAVPGEPYQIPLYRGKTAEVHTVWVTVE